MKLARSAVAFVAPRDAVHVLTPPELATNCREQGTMNVAVTIAVVLAATSCTAHEPLRGNVDRVVVEKEARRLTLVSNGGALRTYRVALGGDPVGHKQREGDERTPEGLLSDAAQPLSSERLQRNS